MRLKDYDSRDGHLKMIVASVIALPFIAIVDVYYRVRYGVWLHRAVEEAFDEVVN